MPDPIISVITATYNRSNILRYTIQSVLASTFSDWELLVVGDACTDDTENVVASFDDPRFRFSNLNENCGDQSGPNNAPLEMARGDYIAYLNHDDLYFPDHLIGSLDAIRSSDADLVFASAAAIRPVASGTWHPDEWEVLVTAPSSDSAYEPFVFSPASTWLLQRGIIDDIGPWCSWSETYWMPS